MAKMLKTSSADRKCHHPGCLHILSIYNHEVFCHVHLDRKQNPNTQKTFMLTGPMVTPELAQEPAAAEVL
jgi:hypothetical protein